MGWDTARVGLEKIIAWNSRQAEVHPLSKGRCHELVIVKVKLNKFVVKVKFAVFQFPPLNILNYFPSKEVFVNESVKEAHHNLWASQAALRTLWKLAYDKVNDLLSLLGDVFKGPKLTSHIFYELFVNFLV